VFMTDVSKEDVKRMKNIGSNSISIIPTLYMDSLGSTVLRDDFSPTDESLRNIIRKSRKKGLEVMLKPHVDFSDSRSRSEIRFFDDSSWKAWFLSYERFIMKYLKIAGEEKVKLFCIGTELEGTVERPEWHSIISDARKIYRGKLTYASNYPTEEHCRVPFWNELDYIGIDLYPYIRINWGDVTPERIEFVLERDKVFENLFKFSAGIGKKILITEWGYKYKSPEGDETWNWISDKQPSEKDQEAYYLAFARQIKKQKELKKDFIKGYFVWVWHPESKDYQDKFCPRNQPAEKILKDFYNDNLN